MLVSHDAIHAGLAELEARLADAIPDDGLPQARARLLAADLTRRNALRELLVVLARRSDSAAAEIIGNLVDTRGHLDSFLNQYLSRWSNGEAMDHWAQYRLAAREKIDMMRRCLATEVVLLGRVERLSPLGDAPRAA
ncbi:hypothetical protein GVO57_05300 [Sphingomonas changnyeongensis]|uniref:Uncharacterized protein n=1 Tax=Sphingomonas changnyeongensis TaxID=2698679 RepID=A0A7Z2S4R9_9SPHN|nr:hypothetical protein [Sphingomonas changnyeongensis]QHL90360.1 hypothetical protein GVO57_05300 [Sphingomonas changnyeongensis]